MNVQQEDGQGSHLQTFPRLGIRGAYCCLAGCWLNRDPDNGTRTVYDMGGFLDCDLASFLDFRLLPIAGLRRVCAVAVLIFALCGHISIDAQ